MRIAIHGMVFLSVVLLSTAGSLSQEFRIETELFDGKREEPISRHLTLFCDGIVYDLRRTEPNEIAVYSPRSGHFKLLDTSRRVQTRIPASTLRKFTSSMKVTANAMGPVVRFMASPEFNSRFDDMKHELVMDSRVMTYRVQCTHAEDEKTVRLYREFADGFAHLNATLPGARPPFARLELNAELAQLQRIPTEVELTIRIRKSGASQTVINRSTHKMASGLRESDRSEIAQIGGYLAKYEDVSFGQYGNLYRETEKEPDAGLK